MFIYYSLAILGNTERNCVEEIFEKYHKLIYEIAYRILKRKSDAEDVLDEVMINVIKNIEKFICKGKNEIEAQLVIYTRNCAINLYNKNRRKSRVEVPFTYINKDEEFEDIEIEDVRQRVDEIVLTRETKEIIKKHLMKLSLEYRDVIKLVYALGYSNVEAAAVLQISPNAVGLRLFRAKKKLIQSMGEELIEH